MGLRRRKGAPPHGLGGADAGEAWRGAADHLAEKLVLCADFMANAYAQQEARVRLARMRRVIRELAEERA